MTILVIIEIMIQVFMVHREVLIMKAMGEDLDGGRDMTAEERRG